MLQSQIVAGGAVQIPYQPRSLEKNEHVPVPLPELMDWLPWEETDHTRRIRQEKRRRERQIFEQQSRPDPQQIFEDPEQKSILGQLWSYGSSLVFHSSQNVGTTVDSLSLQVEQTITQNQSQRYSYYFSEFSALYESSTTSSPSPSETTSSPSPTETTSSTSQSSLTSSAPPPTFPSAPSPDMPSSADSTLSVVPLSSPPSSPKHQNSVPLPSDSVVGGSDHRVDPPPLWYEYGCTVISGQKGFSGYLWVTSKFIAFYSASSTLLMKFLIPWRSVLSIHHGSALPTRITNRPPFIQLILNLNVQHNAMIIYTDDSHVHEFYNIHTIHDPISNWHDHAFNVMDHAFHVERRTLAAPIGLSKKSQSEI